MTSGTEHRPAAGSETLSGRWAVFLVLLPFVLFPFLGGFFGTIAVRVYGIDPRDVGSVLPDWLPLLIAVHHLVLLGLLGWALRRGGSGFARLGWSAGNRSVVREIALGLALGLLVYVFHELVLEPLHDLVTRRSVEFSVGLRPAASVWWSFVAVAVALPFIEESVYRAFWWRAMRCRLGPVLTVLLGSLAFGLSHWYGGVWTVFSSAALGVLFFLIFLARDRTLVAVTLAHMTHNLVALLIA